MFQHERTIPLLHSAQCSLIGVTVDWHIYVDEMDTDSHVTQHHYNASGTLIERAAEREGHDWLTLPETLLAPRWPQQHPLNHSGARWQGMREAERVQALAQSLSIMQKMTLIERLGLSISAMQLLGLIESRVLCETRLTDTQQLVCRRVRLARALPNVQFDADNQPFDYDSVVRHVLHPYNTATDTAPPLEDCLNGFAGVELMHPQDCFYYEGRLLVCDASDGTQNSRIVLYTADPDAS